jgi:hypothetical protein
VSVISGGRDNAAIAQPGTRIPRPWRRPASRSSTAALTASSGYVRVWSSTLPWAASTISFGEVVVFANQVADDASLGGDDVDGRDVDRAAVPDDETRASPSRQVPAQRLRPPLRNEVEDDFGAVAIGHFENLFARTVICQDGVVRTVPIDQIQRGLVAVEDDDRGRGEGFEGSDADVAEPASADDQRCRSRVQQGDSVLQLEMGQVLPLALVDVQTGKAQAGGADAHQHIEPVAAVPYLAIA